MSTDHNTLVAAAHRYMLVVKRLGEDSGYNRLTFFEAPISKMPNDDLGMEAVRRWQELNDSGKALTDALASKPAAEGARYRHKKRGTTYEVIGTAELQIATAPVFEGSPLVVYRSGADGMLYARDHMEFHDGRFEALSRPAAAAPMKMLVDNDWLRDKIESDPDPDLPIEAGSAAAAPEPAGQGVFRAKVSDELASFRTGALQMLMNEDSGGDGWWAGWEMVKAALAHQPPAAPEASQSDGRLVRELLNAQHEHDNMRSEETKRVRDDLRAALLRRLAESRPAATRGDVA